MITQFIGDSESHEVDLEWKGGTFTPGTDWAMVFTAKRKASDPDTLAVIQKATGAGLSAVGSTATIALVRADSEDFTATRTLYCGIRATHGTTGETRTVWQDKIKFERGIPRESTTSIAVVTTETPVPFAASVTSTTVLAALASMSAEEITALRAILADASVMLAPIPS